jgi:hypothetical protein
VSVQSQLITVNTHTECPTQNRPHSLVKYKSTYSRKALYMVQTKIWQTTLFQNLIFFTNHNRNLQEMLEMASFLKYVDLYLTSEWGRFYEADPVQPYVLTYIRPYTHTYRRTYIYWITIIYQYRRHRSRRGAISHKTVSYLQKMCTKSWFEHLMKMRHLEGQYWWNG